MRIARFYGHSGANGVTNAMLDYNRRLTERGHAIHLFCRLDSQLRGYQDRSLYLYCSGLHHPFLRSLLRKGLRRFQADLLVVHSQRDSDIALKVAREVGIPTCYVAHELSHTACKLAPLADAVMAVSVGVGNFLRDEYGIPDSRLHVVPNGIDLAILPTEERASLRQEFGFAPDEIWLGFLGRVVANKNVDGLVSALGRIAGQAPHLRLAIIGSGSKEKEVRQLIHNLGLQQRIRLTGWLPRAQALRMISALDTLVLPSRGAEGLSNAVLQAMALRVPVLASDIPSLVGGPVKHGETGWLFDCQDPDRFDEALLVVAHSTPEQRCAISEAARLEIERNHRIETVVDRMEAAFLNTAQQATPVIVPR